jgi:hypothetical protein
MHSATGENFEYKNLDSFSWSFFISPAYLALRTSNILRKANLPYYNFSNSLSLAPYGK